MIGEIPLEHYPILSFKYSGRVHPLFRFPYEYASDFSTTHLAALLSKTNSKLYLKGTATGFPPRARRSFKMRCNLTRKLQHRTGHNGCTWRAVPYQRWPEFHQGLTPGPELNLISVSRNYNHFAIPTCGDYCLPTLID